MSHPVYTVVILSTDAVFSNRIAGIFEPPGNFEVLRAASVEQADLLIREVDAARIGAVAVVVMSSSEDLASEASFLSGRQAGRADGPSILVLRPTMTDDELLQFIASGVEGYLPDGSGEDIIRLAVKGVAHELSIMPRKVQRRIGELLTESRASANHATPAAPLTAREKEILGGIVAGHSNGEIARTLKVSEGTVKTHVKAIFQKTRSTNRTQAAMRALRDRIVER